MLPVPVQPSPIGADAPAFEGAVSVNPDMIAVRPEFDQGYVPLVALYMAEVSVSVRSRARSASQTWVVRWWTDLTGGGLCALAVPRSKETSRSAAMAATAMAGSRKRERSLDTTFGGGGGGGTAVRPFKGSPRMLAVLSGRECAGNNPCCHSSRGVVNAQRSELRGIGGGA